MSVKYNNSGLTNIIKGMKRDYAARVGILGNKNHRGDTTLTNAEIGAVHEFGSLSRNIPKRSFIRMPLEVKLPEWLRRHGEDYFYFAEKGALDEFYEGLGLDAEVMIAEAFETGGFGTWQPDSPQTIKRKGSDWILVDKSELRNSISSEVVDV